jgi:hypothetical protein
VTRTPNEPRETPAAAGAIDPDSLVHELAAIVALQKTRLQAGDVAGAIALVRKTDLLLLRLGQGRQLTASCRQRLSEILPEHRAVCLAVAMRKKELKDRLSTVRRRHAVLGAYFPRG